MEYFDKTKLEELLPEAGALSVSEIKDLTERAARAVEFLTKDLVRPRVIKLRLMLHREPIQLDYFPIFDVKVNGMELDYESETGIIIPDLPAHSYIVCFRVGYERSQLPVIVESLILHLVAYEISGRNDFKEEAIAESTNIRYHRQKVKERNNV